MGRSDRHIRLKRKRMKSVSQSLGNERYADFIQDQFNTQDTLASTPTTQGKMSMRRRARKANARTTPNRLFSSQTPSPHAPTMTDPGAFVLTGTEYDITIARALTITMIAASLIAAIQSRFRLWLARKPVSTSTSTVVMLSLGSRMGGTAMARFPSLSLLGLNQGVWAGIAPQGARRSNAVSDDFVQSNSRPFPHCALGGHGEFGSL